MTRGCVKTPSENFRSCADRVAGTGHMGLAEEGAQGVRAPLNDPENLVVLSDGTVLITDGDNGRVVALEADGSLHRFAGQRSEK